MPHASIWDHSERQVESSPWNSGISRGLDVAASPFNSSLCPVLPPALPVRVDLEGTPQNKLPTANLFPPLVSWELDQSQYKINAFEGEYSEREGLDMGKQASRCLQWSKRDGRRVQRQPECSNHENWYWCSTRLSQIKKVNPELTPLNKCRSQAPGGTVECSSACMGSWVCRGEWGDYPPKCILAATRSAVCFSNVHNLSPFGKCNDSRDEAPAKPWELMTSENNLVFKWEIAETFLKRFLFLFFKTTAFFPLITKWNVLEP